MLITFVIAITIITSIYLWFWALTQSQCNKNSDDIKTGFNIVKNEFKVQEGFNQAILERVKKLEQKVAETERKIPLAPFMPITPHLIIQKMEEQKEPAAEEAKPELGYTIRVTDNGCTGIRPGTEDETNNDVG